MQPQSILRFWFEELTAKQHFVKDAALDETIRARFGDTLEAAARCELFAWRATAEGRLAEIIVLDQFSRNFYRDTPRAFAQDALALVLAQELVASTQDRNLPEAQRVFAYMPSCTASPRWCMPKRRRRRMFAAEQGYLAPNGDKHALTTKGEKAAIEFVAKSRFGPYFLWPQDIHLS